MITKFSSFRCDAESEKLWEPVMTVQSGENGSITITFECTMAIIPAASISFTLNSASAHDGLSSSLIPEGRKTLRWNAWGGVPDFTTWPPTLTILPVFEG